MTSRASSRIANGSQRDMAHRPIVCWLEPGARHDCRRCRSRLRRCAATPMRRCRRRAGRACAILTADCVPVLICDRAGTMVGAAHCGWRGLAHGVLDALLAAMPDRARRTRSHGSDPRLARHATKSVPTCATRSARDDVTADRRSGRCVRSHGKWLANLYELARSQLSALGVAAVYGGGLCTLRRCALLFVSARWSHRPDGDADLVVRRAELNQPPALATAGACRFVVGCRDCSSSTMPRCASSMRDCRSSSGILRFLAVGSCHADATARTTGVRARPANACNLLRECARFLLYAPASAFFRLSSIACCLRARARVARSSAFGAAVPALSRRSGAPAIVLDLFAFDAVGELLRVVDDAVGVDVAVDL